ncbi:MAG TPA: DUF3052 domain-containing protein [Gemmatimonadales bacterium]
MPGYSGTPLAKKLGFTKPMDVLVVAAPAEYQEWLGPLPDGVHIVTRTSGAAVAAHLFVTRRSELAKQLDRFRERLDPAGFVWVSWPKRASKVTTDVTEDVVRDLALPLGFVDIKVCAVSEVWSGLKLVIRRELRG